MFVDLHVRRGCVCLVLACLVIPSLPTVSWGQMGTSDPVQFRVEGASQRLEMIANSSRILTLDKEIPRALVNNTEIVRVVPLSPNQVQVSALQPGVTQINLWDEDGDIHSVDVVVFGDARQLEMLIRSEFPHAALRIRPLASSVVLSGYVDRPEIISRIVRLAEDYYPKVINNITVGGVQQVALHIKVMEISRTKLRTLGFDWALFDGPDFTYQAVSGLLGNDPGEGIGTLIASGTETLAFGVIDQNNQFYGLLEALRQNNLAKVLAEPTLVTVSGRPATFLSGGEFPVLVPQSLGTVSVDYKEFGTRVDFVPIVLGNGNIRLEVRPNVSEIDPARSVTYDGLTVPGLRARYADTAAELRAGQTLAIAGLMQSRVESEVRGLPWVSDLPWVGAAFRKIKEEVNDIELLILVRPELVDALEPHEVPCPGPGQSTTSPNDVELYLRGYIEVPNCCDPCNQTGQPVLPPGAEAIQGHPMVSPNGSAYPGNSGANYESVAPVTGPAVHSGAAAANTSAYRHRSYNQSSHAYRDDRPVRRSTYRTTDQFVPPYRHTANGGSISSNRSTPSQESTQQGLFGPTGYDKLD